MAKKVKSGERLFTSKKDNADYQDRLIKLMSASGWKPDMYYLGELFISEIRSSQDSANEHLRQRAKMLGLMEWGFKDD
jgi:hypothetical protein